MTPCVALRRAAFAVALAWALAACASFGGRDAVRVSVAGVESLQGAGMELRFVVKLRVQNASESAIEYDGVVVDLDVNGMNLASGVSDQAGSVPRFGEALVNVPVSVSAFAALRQALAASKVAERGELPYAVRGRLAGAGFGSVSFADSGTLALAR